MQNELKELRAEFKEAFIEKVNEEVKPSLQAPITNDITADSLTIKIPIEYVSDADYLRNIVVTKYNQDTMEILEEKYTPSHYNQDTGIKTTIFLEKEKFKSKSNADYKNLVIYANSKTLKENYFQGLRLSNIEEVYDYIISLDIAKFSIDSFLHKSTCFDIDYKRDFFCTRNELLRLMKNLADCSYDSKKRDIGYNQFKETDNTGIEFGNRHTDSYNHVYWKIYAKALELYAKPEKKGSNDFRENYLSAYDITDIVRSEFTFKGKKTTDHFGIKDRSLNGILSIPQSELNKMQNKVISNHIDHNANAPREIKAKESVQDRLYLELMRTYIDNNSFTFDRFIEQITVNCNLERKEKHRTKEKFLRLYNQYLADTTLIHETGNVQKIFEMFGLNSLLK